MTLNTLERARAFVQENFMYARPDQELGEDDRLLDLGIIDSMGVMELIEFIQDEFHVTVEDDEITEENLGSLRAIANFITSKTDPAPTKVPAMN